MYPKDENEGDLPFDTKEKMEIYHMPSIICLRLDAIAGCIKSPPCLSVPFMGVASPPVQCSKTGLKMRNKKCEIPTHPSNV